MNIKRRLTPPIWTPPKGKKRNNQMSLTHLFMTMKLKIARVIFYLGILAISPTASAYGYQDALGRVFIDDGSGSQMGSYMMSVSVKVESRSTVSIGFIHGDMVWNDPSVPASAKSLQNLTVSYVMLNCKEKTYSTYPVNENAATLRVYKSGTDFKWGDYGKFDEPTSKLVMNVADQYKAELTRYFKVVCDYTGQF